MMLFCLCFSAYCSESRPYGGNGGTAFSDADTYKDPTQAELKKISIRYGDYVDSITCEWITGEVRTIGKLHGGGGGGSEGSVELEAGERINRIVVRHGQYVDQLTFHTSNNRVFGPYGGSGGSAAEYNCYRLVGFAGRSGDYIDQIQFICEDKPIAARP